ncbi:hypothetical protein [Dokdonia sp. Hel_I_53]|uniref:hypothetical protein n=1 Tax=Dokdonia sp. Hel_I_53 TaxID=1566287 RepID=UPI00119C712B|nr:hypothetical protein [Dokdonia sp. Hel_I_53]TVZ52320.1 hypothetical protein OD90_1493 [Dokdonia sp. Hel_I_53]
MKTVCYYICDFTLSRKRMYLPILFFMCFVACSKESPNLDDNDGDVTTDDEMSSAGLTILFANAIGGSQNDTFKAVVVTSDGGYAMLGDSQSIDGVISDNDTQINKLWFVKTESNGEVQFSKTYGGSEDSRGTDIITTTDGGYAILGYSESSDGDLTENNGFYDQWIAKLDAQGNLIWQKSFGFSGSDQANALIQTKDGGFFTTGFLDVSASNGEGNDGLLPNRKSTPSSKGILHGVGEFWGHKLDSNGNLEWRRYFGGSDNDRSYDVVQAPDDGILMIGNSESNDFDITASQGSYDFWAVRLDGDGNLLWQKSLGGSQIDIGYAVTTTTDGAYIIAGDTRSDGGDVTNLRGSADVWLVKLSDSGELLWEKSFGGSNFDSARAITKIPKGYAIAGASRSVDGQVSENNGQNDFWIATIDFSGNLMDEITLGGNNQDFGYGISATSQGEIIVVGDTSSTSGPLTTTNGGTDGVLIKITQ